MEMKLEDAAKVALITAIGTVVVQWLKDGPKIMKIRDDREALIRKDLNDRIEKLDMKLTSVSSELDSWKERCLQLSTKCGHLEIKIEALEVQMNYIKDQILTDEQKVKLFKERRYENGSYS